MNSPLFAPRQFQAKTFRLDIHGGFSNILLLRSSVYLLHLNVISPLSSISISPILSLCPNALGFYLAGGRRYGFLHNSLMWVGWAFARSCWFIQYLNHVFINQSLINHFHPFLFVQKPITLLQSNPCLFEYGRPGLQLIRNVFKPTLLGFVPLVAGLIETLTCSSLSSFKF